MITGLVNAGVVIVALLHIWFCILEMFLWQRPIGRRIFNLDFEFANRTAPLAANQGLYNLFLSAGLFFSLVVNDLNTAWYFKIFFLNCVSLAGIFGGITVNARIFIIQAIPALLVLSLLLFI